MAVLTFLCGNLLHLRLIHLFLIVNLKHVLVYTYNNTNIYE